jgi:rare lipoprotein A (peptidoglycan hydrolase)
MTRPGRPFLLLFATLTAAALLPVAAHAQATTPPPAQSQVVQVNDGHFAVSARAGTMLRRTARFRGTAPAGAAGRELAVQRFDVATQAWVVEASTTANPDGTFLARWRTNHIGEFRVRVVLQGGDGASAAAASPELTVTVYKSAMATWYGPGLHGRRTACGQRLSPELLGVAHRRLPCGTPVALYYQGRTMVVPVVDRGPFRRGMTWDLTEATARALGFTTTDRIGAVRLREPAAPPA